MDFIFDKTITGSITAIIILIIKVILKDKVKPKWYMCLWGILLIRLMMPVLPASSISIFNKIPEVRSVSFSQIQTENIKPENIKKVKEDYLSNNTNVQIKKSLSNKAIKNIWLAGCFISFIYLIVVYSIFLRRVRKLDICSNKDILQILNKYKNKINIKDNVEIIRGGESPMLVGVIKPKILIPNGYKSEEIEQILIHELCHIKYKDVFINIIISFITCLYWFNPIIWIASINIRRDMEMLCDQRVLNITEDRKLYATVLLDTALKKKHFILCTTSMENGEKQIKRRIKMIANGKKTKFIYTIIAIAVLGTVGIACLTNKENKNVQAASIEIEENLDAIDGLKEMNYDKLTVAFKYSVYDEQLGKSVEKFSEARPISNASVIEAVKNNLKDIKFIEIKESDFKNLQENKELTYDITFYQNNEKKGNIRFYDLDTVIYNLDNKVYINDSSKNDNETIISNMENIITIFKPVNFD